MALGVVAVSAMREALGKGENELIDPEKIVPAGLLTFPSTLSYIDEECGGFYGLVTVGAERGTGKTMLALASAISSAAAGWDVFYFASEDDSEGLAVRFNNFMNANKEMAGGIPNFHLFQTARGQTPASLTEEIAKVTSGEKPILVVIDSLNSLVEMSDYSYLDGLTQFGLWMMLARRISKGNASFLCISETNKSGSIKGEKLPYWSDQVLVMKRGGGDVVDMELQKSRRTQGVGEMGKWIRIWNQGEFISQNELDEMRRSSLRVVAGGATSLADRVPGKQAGLFGK